MKTVTVSLNSIDKVKSFVKDITRYAGHNFIDAKSIMGIFSFDLSKPLQLNIHSKNHADEIIKSLDKYIC